MKVTASFIKNFFFVILFFGTFGHRAWAFSAAHMDSVRTFEKLSQVAEHSDIQADTQIEHPDEAVFEEIEASSGKTAKIIIAGDSWAMFPCLFGSMRRMLKEEGFPLRSDMRCVLTSRMGIRADQWNDSGFDKRLKKYLKKDPRIKYVYLSLGGNDIMKYWNTTFSPEAEEQLFKKTFNIMKKAADDYIKIRPDIKIIFSGYDFGRLTERNLISLYTTIYFRMLKPNPEQVNELLIRFTRAMQPLENGRNIFYMHHLGLSHYFDGVPEKGLKRHSTLAPDQIATWDEPLKIGGAPALPNSKKSMINWMGLSRDAIHISSQNYYLLMKHTFHNLMTHIINRPLVDPSRSQH